MSQRRLPPLGLYIHFPWCEKKCPYCDFNSHESTEIPQSDYVDALLKDLENDLCHVQHRSIDTLFIGGGTPSLISTDALEQLMQGLRQRLDFSPTIEATMEANPGSAEAEKFESFFNAGINRLSLGIQSFQDKQLEALGRIHNSDQAHAAIEMAKSAGFKQLNLDLMHGLPNQSIENASSDLRSALAHNPSHLSWYQLTIEPNTKFYNAPPMLPVEDTLANIQEQGERLLRGAGLTQYEVSAWSKPGFTCRHNTNYWHFGDYLAIGAGAHGKITNKENGVLRYAKRRQPNEYLSSAGGSYLSQSRRLDPAEISGEFMLNALRLNEGFSLEQFESYTGLTLQHLEPQLSILCEKDLLSLNDGRIRTTELGRRFLDSVVGDFFND
jgi:putative oxygen-independent coproporphyrinogen III oxidase